MFPSKLTINQQVQKQWDAVGDRFVKLKIDLWSGQLVDGGIYLECWCDRCVLNFDGC